MHQEAIVRRVERPGAVGLEGRALILEEHDLGDDAEGELGADEDVEQSDLVGPPRVVVHHDEVHGAHFGADEEGVVVGGSNAHFALTDVVVLVACPRGAGGSGTIAAPHVQGGRSVVAGSHDAVRHDHRACREGDGVGDVGEVGVCARGVNSL